MVIHPWSATLNGKLPAGGSISMQANYHSGERRFTQVDDLETKCHATFNWSIRPPELLGPAGHSIGSAPLLGPALLDPPRLQQGAKRFVPHLATLIFDAQRFRHPKGRLAMTFRLTDYIRATRLVAVGFVTATTIT